MIQPFIVSMSNVIAEDWQRTSTSIRLAYIPAGIYMREIEVEIISQAILLYRICQKHVPSSLLGKLGTQRKPQSPLTALPILTSQRPPGRSGTGLTTKWQGALSRATTSRVITRIRIPVSILWS